MITSQSLVLTDLKEGPKLVSAPIQPPGAGEVQIKLECAPVTDRDWLMAHRGIFIPPFTLGVQASGTVSALGTGVPLSYMGKKVLVGSWPLRQFTPAGWEGVWSQYLLRNYEDVFVYDQSIPNEMACTMYLAPLTALGLLREVLAAKAKTVLLTPGASPTSKILMKLLKSHSVSVISVVRSAEGAKFLKEIGHEAVLSTEDPEFEKHFSQMCAAQSPSMLLDGACDDLSGLMLTRMPDKAVHVVYSVQGEGGEIPLPVFPFVLSAKTIRGFSLIHYHMGRTAAEARKELFKDLAQVNEDVAKGSGSFGIVPVAEEYALADFAKAFHESAKGYSVIRFK